MPAWPSALLARFREIIVAPFCSASPRARTPFCVMLLEARSRTDIGGGY